MSLYRVCRKLFVALLVLSIAAQPSRSIGAGQLHPDASGAHNCREITLDLGSDAGVSVTIGSNWQLRIRF